MTPHKKKHTLVCEKSKQIADTLSEGFQGVPWRSAVQYPQMLFPEAGQRGFLPVLKDRVSAQGPNR